MRLRTIVTPEAVETTLRDALAQFGSEPEEITRYTTFDQLDVDSLQLAELSLIVEDEYGVTLRGDDVGKTKTVRDTVELVVNRLDEGAARLL